MAECPICANDIEYYADTILGEILECFDCGSELEVTGINPDSVEVAPEPDEDWGQ